MSEEITVDGIIDLGEKFGKVKIDFENLTVEDYENLSSGLQDDKTSFGAMKNLLKDCVVNAESGEAVFDDAAIRKMKLKELKVIIEKVMDGQRSVADELKKN